MPIVRWRTPFDPPFGKEQRGGSKPAPQPRTKEWQHLQGLRGTTGGVGRSQRGRCNKS